MQLTNDEKLFLADANAIDGIKSVFEFVHKKDGKYVPVHKFFLREMVEKTDAELINKFILPNHGKIEGTPFKTGYKQPQELKTKADITDFYFFYHDFDLKDPAGNHYIGNELTEKKKALLNQINTLPLDVDYVVESRNGFHIYYTINPDDRKSLTSALWHHIQRGIFDYIYNNISPTVDHACKKSNQLLRLPGSFHQKQENTDLFKVDIIKTKDFSKKVNAILKNTYNPGMFSHRIIEFMHAFNISTILNETKTISSTTKINKTTTKTTTNIAKNTTTTFCRESSYRNNSVVYAISQKNPNDACFENIKTDAKNKFGDRTISITDATEYIKSIDMRNVLNINAESDNDVHSLFYSDINPSDYFYQSENHTVSYYCRCEDKWYNSIFDIIARVFYPDRILDTETWSDVYKFAYEMFGLNVMFKNNPTEVTAQFDKIRADNINTFKSIVAHSKKTKYLKAYTDLYELIMDLWAEHVNEYNIPYMQCHRDLGAEWLSSKLAERGIKKRKQWILQGLMILRFIGVLTKIVGNQNSKVSLPDTKQGVGDNVNRYTFPILKTNIDEIIKRAEIIRFTFDKPSIQVSEKKLTELALDYDLESAFTKF